MNIRLRDFATDRSVVARVIYGTQPHQTTSMGVQLSARVAVELSKFLSEFNAFVGVEQIPYYRIDAYFDENTLWILEVNASFVDGWGIALNLARASGISILPSRLLAFPTWFTTHDPVYLPELKLFVQELREMGIVSEILEEVPADGEPVYVYGRVGRKEEPHILPYDGIRLDNKMNLCRVSRTWTWQGTVVRIPGHYSHETHRWEDVPDSAVLKFCEKGGEVQRRVRQSVIIGKSGNGAPFLKRCYATGELLAQDLVQPTRYDGKNCQLVLLAVGDFVVTGYVQFSHKRIITDDSVHGPLALTR